MAMLGVLKAWGPDHGDHGLQDPSPNLESQLWVPWHREDTEGLKATTTKAQGGVKRRQGWSVRA